MNPAGVRDRILNLSYPDRRWFAFADLLCAAASAALITSGLPWLRSPQGGWPLLIGLLPWAARLTAGRSPFRRTSFDLPLAIFLGMAGVGVWASYEPAAAWPKLWMLLSAALVFYALAGQPRANLKPVAGLLGVLGAGLALAFLLGHDWSLQPADVQVLNRIGMRWMAVRPSLPIPMLFPNMVGGILAMCIPISLAFGLQTWREHGRTGGFTLLLLAALSSILMGLGLLFTSSRGAWFALAAGLGVWLLWEFLFKTLRVSDFKTLRVFQTLRVWTMVSLVLLAFLGIVLALASPGVLLRLAGSLPGLNDSGSRADLARQSLGLIADFPFTGGGLGAFAGLYSHYILVLPVFLFSYAHNFYLDVAIEQGLPGLLALLVVFTGSAGLLLARSKGEEGESGASWLAGPLLAALSAVGLHGLVDDALYGNAGTPLLFVLPGLAVALSQPSNKTLRVFKTLRVWMVILAILLALFTAFRRPLLSAWYADLGAVRMARIDLAGFPTNRWDEGRNAAALAPAKALFERALALSPDNRTASYRLGLAALLERDFPAAVARLERAYRPGELPEHRGIRKNLGYAYVWVGDYNRAIPLLKDLPEAGAELNSYVWFWRGLDRNDLASQASLALSYLQAAQAQP